MHKNDIFRKEKTKIFQKIALLIEYLRIQCKQLFQSFENIANEHSVKYDHRSGLRQCIANKSVKSKLELWVLLDRASRYGYNLNVLMFPPLKINEN